MKLFKNRREDGGAVAVAEPETKSESLSDSPVDVHAELSAVQAEINTLQADRSRLEEESRILAERLAVIAAQSEEAKVQLASCATGSSSTVSLDALDRERVELQRRREGIQIRVERLSHRQAPLQAKARELAQVVDQHRQDAVVAEFRKRAEQLSREIIAGWEMACIQSFELSTLIEDVAHSNLTPDHRSQVLAIGETLNNFFLKASLEPVNAGWVRKETHLTRRMAVIAARPK